MEDVVEEIDLSREPHAMAAVFDAVKDLPPASQRRVIQWAASAFGVSGGSGSIVTRQSPGEQVDTTVATSERDKFPDFADLLGDSSPTTDADKALVGGYWLQVVLGQEDFVSQAVNEELKNTGNAIGNITRAFDSLKNSKPQLVRQLLKTGRSQQARKRLKLTTAGIARVREMINGGGHDD